MNFDLSKVEFNAGFVIALLNQSTENLLKILDDGVNKGIELLPLAKELAVDVLDIMFSPRQILRQMAIVVAIKFLLLGYDGGNKILGALSYFFSKKGKEEKRLLEQLAIAKSYLEWKEIALKLDEMDDLDVWRYTKDSTLYDEKVVERRIKQTLEMLDRGDVFDLIFRFRGGLARDQFGMQHEGLFSRALSGTKVLVERYHETMAKALNFICDSPISDDEVRLDCLLF